MNLVTKLPFLTIDLITNYLTVSCSGYIQLNINIQICRGQLITIKDLYQSPSGVVQNLVILELIEGGGLLNYRNQICVKYNCYYILMLEPSLRLKKYERFN